MKRSAVLLVSTMFLSACTLGTNSLPTPTPALTVVGSWKLTSMSLPRQEAVMANQNADVQSAFKAQMEEVASKATAEFRSDSTFTIAIADVSTLGTYTVSEDGKVITTAVPQQDGTVKTEDINIVELKENDMKLRSAVLGESGQTEELILTFARQVGG